MKAIILILLLISCKKQTDFLQTQDNKISYLGSITENIDYPFGLAIDNEGFLYVSNFAKCQVQKYTFDGKFIAWIGIDKDGNETAYWNTDISKDNGTKCTKSWGQPHGIHIYKDGRFAVSFYRDNNIKFFNKDGSKYDEIFPDATIGLASYYEKDSNTLTADFRGDKIILNGSELIDEKLIHPNIAIFYNDEILVVSTLGNTILKYDLYGNKINWKNEDTNALDAPTSIAVDSKNRIYVTEFGGDRISVFNYDGEFLYHLLNKEIKEPYALMIKDDILIIADTGNTRVLKYKIRD